MIEPETIVLLPQSYHVSTRKPPETLRTQLDDTPQSNERSFSDYTSPPDTIIDYSISTR